MIFYTSYLPAQESMAHSLTSHKLIALACIAVFFPHPFQSEICSGLGANHPVSVRSAAAVCDTHHSSSVAELCGASHKSVSPTNGFSHSVLCTCRLCSLQTVGLWGEKE